MQAMRRLHLLLRLQLLTARFHARRKTQQTGRAFLQQLALIRLQRPLQTRFFTTTFQHKRQPGRPHFRLQAKRPKPQRTHGRTLFLTTRRQLLTPLTKAGTAQTLRQQLGALTMQQTFTHALQMMGFPTRQASSSS